MSNYKSEACLHPATITLFEEKVWPDKFNDNS